MIIANAIWQSLRPNFLVLSVAVVLLAFSIAHYEKSSEDISWGLSILVLIAAVLAHIAVNTLNEYQDFHSGLDSLTQRTEFSGGSGALPKTPQAAPWVFRVFLVAIILLTLIGVYLVQQVGWLLLIIGLIGVALIVFYTKFITRMPWLCLIAPGLAFGPLMIIGSYYVLTGEVSSLAVVLSLVPFFLVNNLLLLNQIPDLEADKKVGRFNVLMQLGLEDGIQIFAAFVWSAFIALGIAMWWFDLPSTVWIGFATLLIAFPMLRDLQLEYQNRENLMPILRMNVIISLLTPILIALGLFFSTL